jgi:glycolate oxidase FAD binding subunit
MQVLRPASEAEAAAMVAAALADKQTLSIEGGGSKRHLGRMISPSGVLKLDALSGIISYEPDELVMTVRAGTPLREVEAALAEKNQCLAFEPSSWSFDANAAPTIGGTIAAGVAGSRRVVLGGARDHIIGFRAVNGEGTIFKAGGKVVKNVTGYDLPKLAAGSFGTLFAMTEVTLRTYPRTRMPTSLVVRDLDIESACALLRRVAGSSWEATGFCYLPRVALERLDGAFQDARSLMVIRFEGSGESMAARAQGCAEALGSAGSVVADEGSQLLWQELLQLKPFQSAHVLWRISVPPAEAPHALAALRPDCFMIDWAGGLLWIEHNAGSKPKEHAHRLAIECGGHAMLFRAPDAVRFEEMPFPPRDATMMGVLRRLRQAFDPAGVFDVGRMYASGT